MTSSTFPNSSASERWIVQFLLPPVVVTAAGLSTRWGIQHSLWELVPVFLLVTAVCAIWCVILGARFAFKIQTAAAAGRSVCIRIGAFLLWVVAGAALAAAGLVAINALPFRVGDGP